MFLNRKIYISIFIFNFLFQFTFGQEQELPSKLLQNAKPLQDVLNFHLLNVSSGLSHNSVNDIKQDSLGFIWIATTDGLNRYDGSNFVHFKKSFDTSSLGLVNNYVQQLEFHSAHELLIATDEGLNIYDIRNEKFKILTQEQGLLNSSVSSITVGPEGNPIIGTYRGGVQFSDEKWRLTSLQEKNGNSSTLSSDEISSMAVQGDSILWVGTFNHGLNKISLKTHKIHRLNDNKTSFPSEVINSLFTDSNENLWIGTRNGLQVISRKGDTLRLSKSGSAFSGLSDDDVLCFEEDIDGQMWIGTRNGGLNIII